MSEENRTVAVGIARSVLCSAIVLAAGLGPAHSQSTAPPDSAVTSGAAIPDTSAAAAGSTLAISPETVIPPDSLRNAPPDPSSRAQRDTTDLEIPPQPIDVEADRLIGSRGPEGEIVLLEGNVVLRQGTTVIRSSQGRWVTADRSVFLTGGVKANDGTVEITADRADYHERAKLILLTGNVHVVDTDLDATSEFGSYDALSRRAELWGHVRATENGRILTCERAIYHRETGRAEALGNVRAADSTGTTVLVATFVDYDRDHQVARAFGSPKLTRIEDGEETVLTADTLVVDNATGVAHAIGDVHVDRDTLQATAGRAKFWDREDRGVLLENPRVWNDEITATGDSIEYFLKDGDLTRAAVLGEGSIEFTSRSPETRGEQNLLKSPYVLAFFNDGRLDSIQALEGAVNIYNGAPRRQRIPERNEIRGQKIAVYFENGDMGAALVTGAPQGTYRFELSQADSARIQQETVHYDGDEVEFEVQKRRIRIDGNAHVAYQSMDLKSGRVMFDSQDETLIARDSPVLKNVNEEELEGRTMTYDLEDGTGTVYHASTEYDRGLYRGQAIHDTGKNVLLVKGAEYTTCDLAEPHYFVGSNTMKVQLRDKIIARPIVFYLKKIPILALPFYIIPVNNERHSGIIFPQIQFGLSSAGGRFVRNLGYYWAPNDYMDFTLSGDYYQNGPSWVGRFETRYKLAGMLDGNVNTRYTRSQALFGSDQWELRGNHNQVLNINTRLTAQANFTSSRDFTRDPLTGEPLANRANRFLVSTLNLNHRRTWGSFNLFLSRRQDLDANPLTSRLPSLTQDLPQFTLSIPQRAIGRKGSDSRSAFLPFLATTYFNVNLRASNHSETFKVLVADSTADLGVREAEETETFRAMQGQFNFSDNRRVPMGWTITPRLSVNSVLYEEDAIGQRWQPGAVYNLGLGGSATYYGTFHPRLGPLQAIRHVVFPTISFSWQPEFESLRITDPESGNLISRFPSRAGISISAAKQRFMSYGLQQRFQIKLRRGDEEVQLPNLITWNTNGSYDFLWRDNGRKTPWLPMTNRIRVQPPHYLTFDLTTVHAFDAWPHLRSMAMTAGLRLNGGSQRPASSVAEIPLAGNEALTRPQLPSKLPWSLSLTYSYSGGRDALQNWKTTQLANVLLSVRPTANWHLDYYNTLNLTRGEITAQEFSVTRDLHCWQARFVRRFTSNGESEFYFKINIRERPDLYLEQGTRGLGAPVNF